ncbi:TetR/AcrR family transcriptional regulator [Limosilactobacillus reuteri]|uniref:TetR/AcrR family transcriptional regulator n=1 Tax=Limosilactobacillus reuteri TaxID=1598 RepID=UPI001CDCD4AE|nr:TetR/AcrR family transcriptional regulator [Limosilactobacillus reuteri]
MKTTKEKIIQTAIEWIITDDYTNLSMRKLANKFGMTTGALYKYFKNKKELFYQVSIRLYQQVAKQLVIDSEISAEDKLLSIANGLCTLSQKQPKLINFLFFNPSLNEFY